MGDDSPRPFFKIRAGSDRRGPNYLHPEGHRTRLAPDGKNAAAYEGAITVTIEGGSIWPDFVKNFTGGGPPFIFSERVRNYVEENCDPKQVPVYPARVRSLKNSRMQAEAPEYFYFSPRGGIDFDRARSPTDQSGEYRAYVPIPGSWSGQHFFTLRRRFQHGIYCTEEVIDAAVREKWVSVEFRPMDLPLGPHYGRWKGIKPRTRSWRKTMYPPVPRPEEVRERLEHLALGDDDETGRRYEAGLFFLALGQQAVEPISRAFESAVDGSEFKAQLAETLEGLHHDGHSVDATVLLRVKRFLEKIDR